MMCEAGRHSDNCSQGVQFLLLSIKTVGRIRQPLVSTSAFQVVELRVASYWLTLESKGSALMRWMTKGTFCYWWIYFSFTTVTIIRNKKTLGLLPLAACDSDYRQQKSTWGTRDYMKVKLNIRQYAFPMDTPLQQSGGEVLRKIQCSRGDLWSLERHYWIFKSSMK